MKYAIYFDPNCNEGFDEEERFDNIEEALFELKKLRGKNKYKDYWLVLIIDE